jgi:hypothetical protein
MVYPAMLSTEYLMFCVDPVVWVTKIVRFVLEKDMLLLAIVPNCTAVPYPTADAIMNELVVSQKAITMYARLGAIETMLVEEPVATEDNVPLAVVNKPPITLVLFPVLPLFEVVPTCRFPPEVSVIAEVKDIVPPDEPVAEE